MERKKVLVTGGAGFVGRHLVKSLLELGNEVFCVDPVAPLLSKLDVFVSPSHSEALSISIMEAMAMGLPCVCTNVGGTAEVIHNEDTGLLVPAHDPAALASAIERLLAQPEFAKRLAENGRALVLAGKYSLGSTLQTVFAEYARVAARQEPLGGR